VTAEQNVVRSLSEAHAMESALVQTLTAHLAITPASEYRDLLERHLAETKGHAAALVRRLSDLGDSRNPLELAYGLAQVAIGQVVAAGKLPLDLLRGSGGEEKLLKNAKDEAASEALEIATYDAIEALATAAGDATTAALAVAHRAEEEAFLADLRSAIPQLARDVLDAQQDDPDPVVADAPARGGGSGGSGDAPAAEVDLPTVALPIDGYDELPVTLVLPKLKLLSMVELVVLEEYERAGRGSKQILDRIAQLRCTTNGSQPARQR
jgi:ferritin-like metal-binding protein YciE